MAFRKDKTPADLELSGEQAIFNKETEDALFNKINKRSFSPSDMPTICAKSSGTSGFQI